ncbi:MAG: redoxin domain-containing protein [Oscillospiraceae bacterium]|nr:redoxin domain-containing protein [Oscillospiraceae bacterium]
MGFAVESVPALTVFFQGLISFFSPCVLPLVPLYVSYLAGGARVVGEDGVSRYPRRKVMVNTLFFVVGISFAFFLLGLGFTALGRFFTGGKVWFARLAGAVMILFGLYQMGVFGRARVLDAERRLPLRLEKWAMNPATALVLGFTFSFAWTPCVGPTLGSVLLMASSAEGGAGFVLIAVYTLGFVLPFLAVGLFTGRVLEFFKAHGRVVQYTVKIGGILLILMGLMTLTGMMGRFSAMMASLGSGPSSSQSQQEAPAGEENAAGAASSQASSAPEQEEEPVLVPAPDFTLTDQYGNTHTLSDYRGQVVFLNFWATWCGPCKNEMPEIQALYERYGENEKDLVVLGMANPASEEYPQNADKSKEEIGEFLEAGGYTFPVVMDETGEWFAQYGISAFPTTFMINAEGEVFGYIIGGLRAEDMESIVQQTITGKRAG